MPASVLRSCKDLAIILCPQQQKGSLYVLLSMVIQLFPATPACTLAALDEILSALQSATQFLFIPSICYLIISTGLSLLLANFCLYGTTSLHHSFVGVPLFVFCI